MIKHGYKYNKIFFIIYPFSKIMKNKACK